MLLASTFDFLQLTSCLINAEHAQVASSGTPTGLNIPYYVEYQIRSNLIAVNLLIYVADIDTFAREMQCDYLRIVIL